MHAAQIMLGYWNHAQANAETFFVLDGKRFFRTGDLASMDEEGYVFMRDRLKRMINASGFKVWPAEVEAALHAHPSILEACVIASPDVRRGETVKAVVTLRAGSARGQRQPAGLVPRAHGDLQGAAHRADRRCAAEVRHREDRVARTAGAGGARSPRRRRSDEAATAH